MRPTHLPLAAALLAAAALTATSAVAATNLLVNGDFEASSSQTATPPGWTNIGHMDGVIGYSVFGTPAYDGLFFYDEGGFGDPANAPGDGIEQTVATIVGHHYSLTFGLTSENGSGAEIADVAIGGQLSQFALGVDGSGPLARPFVTHVIAFTATGASTTIAFTTDAASASLGNNDPMIDGVSFFDTLGAVPEPAAWSLMLAGFGLAGAALRSRRRIELA